MENKERKKLKLEMGQILKKINNAEIKVATGGNLSQSEQVEYDKSIERQSELERLLYGNEVGKNVKSIKEPVKESIKINEEEKDQIESWTNNMENQVLINSNLGETKIPSVVEIEAGSKIQKNELIVVDIKPSSIKEIFEMVVTYESLPDNDYSKEIKDSIKKSIVSKMSLLPEEDMFRIALEIYYKEIKVEEKKLVKQSYKKSKKVVKNDNS